MRNWDVHTKVRWSVTLTVICLLAGLSGMGLNTVGAQTSMCTGNSYADPNDAKANFGQECGQPFQETPDYRCDWFSDGAQPDGFRCTGPGTATTQPEELVNVDNGETDNGGSVDSGDNGDNGDSGDSGDNGDSGDTDNGDTVETVTVEPVSNNNDSSSSPSDSSSNSGASGQSSVAWFWTERGTTGLDSGQTFTAVEVQDQTGTQDGWLNYIEFIPDSEMHRSVFLMDPAGTGDETLTIDLNYRGPNGSESLWRLLLIDQTNQNWVTVFDNSSMPGWVWTSASFEVADAAKYIDGNGQLVAIWQSADAVDASQLDYLNVARSGSVNQPSGPEPSNPEPSNPEPSNPEPSNPEPVPTNLPPADKAFDYQIGGDYPPASNVGSVSRDWFASYPEAGLYNICYVNAFQTQPNSAGLDRIDVTANWPAGTVSSIPDDQWGEMMIRLDNPTSRQLAADHVARMVSTCKQRGYDAVEFDNLDSWTRIPTSDPNGNPYADAFTRSDAIAFAKMIVDHAHGLGLAVAQKNTAELFYDGAHEQIGFDFVVVESCGEYNECATFANAYGDRMVAIEYTQNSYNTVCSQFGARFPIVFADYGVQPYGPRLFC